MNMELANGMRAAMRLIQSKKLMEATRVIQSALSGGEQPAPPAEHAEALLAIEGPVMDLTAEVIEPDARTLSEGGAGLVPGLSLPRFNLEALKVARPTKIVEVPDGAQFLSRSFVCAAGRRDYKLYIPRNHT